MVSDWAIDVAAVLSDLTGNAFLYDKFATGARSFNAALKEDESIN